MRIVVLSIFPRMFPSFFAHGMVRLACERGLLAFEVIDPRDFASDRHRTTDDRPYGGGSGMVMKPEPLAAALRHARRAAPGAEAILLSAQGLPLTQERVVEFSRRGALILVCGRYEGVDDRLCEEEIAEEISIGDYILSGGEVAAMAVIDAVVRLLPGVLGNPDSAARDSFADGLLEHPHYTRPAVFEGRAVPEVLQSGDHRRIARWRKEASLWRTLVHRPDLLRGRPLEDEEREILRGMQATLEEILPPEDPRQPPRLRSGRRAVGGHGSSGNFH